MMKIGVVWRKNRNIELHEKYLNESLPDDSEEESILHCKGINEAGHKAEIVEWDIKAPFRTIEKLMNAKYDLIFNASLEEIYLLEALNIPYSGSGMDLVSLDKATRKIIVSYYGVPTPPFQVISKRDEDFILSIPAPAIVKPVRGRSSCGITDASITSDSQATYHQARKITDTLEQNALVETFIDGMEITVGIWGNEHPEVIALLEIECVNASTNTFENKKDHEIFHCPPRNISKSQTETIINTALKAYKVLNAKDYARIDIIIAKDGTPYFLELNTFPGLHMKSGNERNLHSSYIGTMAKAIGLGNSDVYKHIIDIASERLCLYE